MPKYQLDTSGRVECSAQFQPLGWAIWADLDPFAQGYIEALFAGRRPLIPLRGDSQNPFRSPGFSDLAPETLALIIADCAKVTERPRGALTRMGGVTFWNERQAGTWPDKWPPLTPHLGDDGKVYLS